MGTTLTGTTPQTTYDSLIKVTDNGPLGGSLKTLTDGLGNDSALALSTGAASVTGTLSVSSNLTVDTNTLFVDATNNRVGIGTSSPIDTLHLVKNGASQYASALWTNSNSTASLYVGVGGSSVSDTSLRNNAYILNSAASNLILGTNLTERLRITSTGNVGIGTSSPSVKTEISGSASGDFAALALTNTNQAGTADAATLNFKLGRSVDSFLFTIPAIKFVKEGQWTSTGSTVDGALAFSTIANESTGERMRITSAGNVGIGTSNPDYKLQVSSTTKGIGVNEGNIVISSSDALAANIGGSLGFGATSDYGILTIAKVGGYRENATGTSASSYLAFETRSGGNAVTEKMRITSAGNVGIGTSSPARKLEVVDSLRVTTAGTSRYFDVTEGTIKLYSSNAEPSIKFADYNTGLDRVATIGFEGDFFGRGAMSFVVKEQASGTAAEAMRLTAAGNVGIGTSSPTSKLVVNGDIATSGNIALTGSGAGIFLGGSIGSANGLDDYEEGTWTPTINFSGASVGVTYNFNVGRYTKIGNKITATCFVSVSNKGTSTGNLAVGGLPFALATGTSNYIPVSIRPNQISFADQLIGYAEEQATQVLFQETTMGGAVTSITEADCATAFSAMVQITYFV